MMNDELTPKDPVAMFREVLPLIKLARQLGLSTRYSDGVLTVDARYTRVHDMGAVYEGSKLHWQEETDD